MVRKIKYSGLFVFVLSCVFLMSLFNGKAYGKNEIARSESAPSVAKKDQTEWKKTVESAQKEGKLVMSGDPSEAWRKSLVDLFQQDYPEIKVDYTGMNGRNVLPRVRQERKLGKSLWDLFAGGTTTSYEMRKEGFLDPLLLQLVSENADNGKWVGGIDGLFYDKENKYTACYSMYVQPTVSVNREFIKEEELKSSAQLLDPRFKGKIVMQNPVSGATFSALGNLAFMYGEKYIRDLLSRQDVIVTDDKRQQAEWVVRGKYPIAIGFNETQLVVFQKQGLGRNVVTLEDKVTPVATGLGCISLFKEAPHPNAAKVYINWLLSRNVQSKLAKNVLLNSRRTDVPVVDKKTAVDPARISAYRRYSTEENVEITGRLLPVIKEALQK